PVEGCALLVGIPEAAVPLGRGAPAVGSADGFDVGEESGAGGVAGVEVGGMFRRGK
ncbi:MAG: hypothetical protein JWQ00_2421, partial [Noviherbaspirillum sp.]|nr:hypothetical protein [Noviherbaspirillum sp.]